MKKSLGLNSKIIAYGFDRFKKATDNIESLVQQIAQASDQQTSGLSQINTAIYQVNLATQNNAAGAEETASAASDLKGHTTAMQNVAARMDHLLTGKLKSHEGPKNNEQARSSSDHAPKPEPSPKNNRLSDLAHDQQEETVLWN
jgi:methyl-accepting chemotaxis protein